MVEKLWYVNCMGELCYLADGEWHLHLWAHEREEIRERIEKMTDDEGNFKRDQLVSAEEFFDKYA